MRVVLQMLVVQERVFPHSYGALSLLLIVYVTGTPLGPAGMSDGHICNQRFTRRWLGGDGVAGDAVGSGKAWQEPSLSSFPGQHGPSPAFLGMVLANDILGHAVV